jgi:hypothetical protein
MSWRPLAAEKSPARPKKYCMADLRMLPFPPCLLFFGPPIFSRSYSSADDADAVGPLAELALPFSGLIRDRAAAVGRWGCSSGLLMCLACGVRVGLTGSAPCGSCRGDVCAVFPVSTAIPYRADAGSRGGFGDATMPPCQQPASFSCLARCPMIVSGFDAGAGHGCIQCVVFCSKQYPFSLAKLASQAVVALVYSGGRGETGDEVKIGRDHSLSLPFSAISRAWL